MASPINGRAGAEFVGMHAAAFFSPDLFFASGEQPEGPPGCEKILDEHPIFESLCQLFHARQLALDCGQTLWDFAIEIEDLKKAGVSSGQIRWLVAKNLVEHATEETPVGQSGRRFNPHGGFRLSPSSCFVLSDEGARVFAGIMPEKSSIVFRRAPSVRSDKTAVKKGAGHNDPETDANPLPVWDNMRRELRLGNLIVKKYKCRAANQEAILNAFEEDHWRPRIDDPLPQVMDLDPKRRLSDTIKCLNRKQDHSLLKFGGDGTGEGVIWRYAAE